MAADNTAHDTNIDIPEEDVLRAHLYRLLAGYLARPPSEETLTAAASMSGDESELGRAVHSFGRIARGVTVAQVDKEYHDLFIGLGRGELLPYASYYLTGFLMEKPLARLRTDMDRLGIARNESVKEPEDHVGALMDMMAGLILGAFAEPGDVAAQKRFFDDHIGQWASHFFRDLEGAKSSVFYATLGTIGRIFMEIEQTAFSMD
ncbi:MAG: molecular chaperone TorD family protein [Fimbriimonadaceae bacterium]|nr:molecular chaperone TorD family protein [Alphaproteobacteria bacterium]